MDTGNAAWILTSASLVFLMTPGVAFFYGGMVRAKAVLNMMIMEAAALSVTMVIWVFWGWSIAYAGTMPSDREHNSNFEYCYRYVIHLQPPQSFGGKWVNEE